MMGTCEGAHFGDALLRPSYAKEVPCGEGRWCSMPATTPPLGNG